MVELARGKGTFTFEIVLDKYREEPELSNYLIRVKSMDDYIVGDWTESESRDPVSDFGDHLEKILEQ